MAKKAKSTLKNAIANLTEATPISVAERYKPSKEDIAREKKYRAEDDIRTLQRAEEIKKDKERMTAAKQVAKSQIQDLKKI